MDMAGYKRSAEKEFTRGEILGAEKDEYREGEERREYEDAVYDIQEWLYDGGVAQAIQFITRLPEDQRADVLADRRVLWGASRALRDVLFFEGPTDHCKYIYNFFFPTHHQLLDSEGMENDAKHTFWRMGILKD